MGGKRYSTEQIIVKLREAEIEMGRGVKVPEVCRKLGISEQTFYRWRKRYGGLDRSEVRRLKSLEQENARLKKLLAESMIDNAILKEASSGNF
jgi:putative transposase